MPGNTMCQKEREKQPMKRITCEFMGEKLAFPRILWSSTVKFRSATKYRKKLLIGKKDWFAEHSSPGNSSPDNSSPEDFSLEFFSLEVEDSSPG
jgi:hypothetical protein